MLLLHVHLRQQQQQSLHATKQQHQRLQRLILLKVCLFKLSVDIKL